MRGADHRLTRFPTVAGAGLLLAALLLAGAAAAQPVAFGKNKVHYSNFDWRVLKSEHFDLYYYVEEEELAQLALRMAEDAYRDLQGKFVHAVPDPIPLIIYNSFQDFEQNNITPYFLPEGVAGLTELARGRVLVPFNGSLHDFEVTIHHELVHVFQRSLLAQVHREHFRTPFLSPPLWFSEGLAVHWSEKRDPEADMILRDLVLSGNLPSIEEFWRYGGGFTTYKLGQSVLDFIGRTYGEDRIRLFYERIWMKNDFAQVIRDVLGVTETELSDRWAFALQTRYFPEVEQAKPAGFVSKQLTAKGPANLKPVSLPDSLPGYEHHFIFISPRDGFTNIYTASRVGKEKDVQTLVKGERSPEFESLHLFRSRFDVAADGRLLFVSKHQDRDEVVLFDVVRKKVLRRIGFENLVGLSSPSWAGDGRRFVFSGLSRDGYSDLYLYDLAAERLVRLTYDRYADLDPAFCPWDESIAWSSDRTSGGDRGARNLFLLDLESGEIRHLTRGPWVDSAPVWDPKTRGIYFTSDRDRFSTVCWIDERGNGHQVLKTLDGLFDPRPVPGGKRILATVFRKGTFQVHRFDLPDSAGPAIRLEPAGEEPPWSPEPEGGAVASRRERYRSRFSLDVAQGGVLADPSLRTGEGVQAVLSDMMGNHLIFFDLANTTFSTSDFLRNFSAALTYVNLKRRLNYGLTAFHLAGDFYDTLDFPFYEQRSGAAAFLSYPLSKFQRIETSVSLAYAETDRLSVGFRRKGAVGTHFISLIYDNSLWLPTGPIDGDRFNLTAGLTMNLKEGASENTVLLGDYRRYIRLGLRSAYAIRLQGRWSEGANPEYYWLGGSLGIRTYDFREITGSRTLMLNQEVRFPLVRGLMLGLPMGDLELPGIQGALFLDAGSAWDEGWPPPWYGAYGVGFRMGLGGFLVLRLDVGRRTDFETLGSTHTRFFIGWNY